MERTAPMRSLRESPRILIIFVFLLSALTPVPPRAAEAAVGASPAAEGALRYTVLSGGNRAGTMETRLPAEGVIACHYTYNDRGRGPSIDETISLGAGGIPRKIEIAGNDYFKNDVSEHFSMEAGKASWRNAAEQGETPKGGAAGSASAFYLGIDGTPEELALLARALRAAPGKKLALLPAGEASLVEAGRIEAATSGRTMEVVQYDIVGLSFTPLPIWLDGEGRLFAQGSSYLMVVREGWEGAQDALLRAQTDTASRRLGDVAKRTGRRPAKGIVVKDGDLFDPASGKILPHTTVVIQGNRIVVVGPEGSVAAPDGAEFVSASGKTILPGLWDMHVHTGDDDGLLHLAAGVTSVRDLANDTDELLERRKRFDDGSLAGPRIVMAGIIDGPGPYAGPTKVLADDAAQAKAAVDRYADLGYVQIKIYSSVKPELVPVIVKEAHGRGLRVSGHVPAFMTAEEVVNDGYDEIQHANFLFLNFWADTVKDTRTPLRMTAVAEKAASLDLKSDRVQAFVRLLREKHTVLDPTLNVFESIFTGRKGTVDPVYAAVADRMPPQVRRGFLTGGLPVPDGMDATYRASFESMLAMIRMMHEAGIPIVAGTDSLPGFGYQRELELYGRAGIPAPEVLRIATLGAAKVMKLDRDLGSIEAGKLADVIVVDGHPAADLSDIRRVSRVIKDGVVYDPAALLQAAGVGPPRPNGEGRAIVNP